MSFIQDTGNPLCAISKTVVKSLPVPATTGNYCFAVMASTDTSTSATLAVTMNGGTKTFTQIAIRRQTADFGPSIAMFWRKMDGTEDNLFTGTATTGSGNHSALWVGEFSELPSAGLTILNNSTASADAADTTTSRATGNVTGIGAAVNLVLAAWYCRLDVSSKNIGGLTNVGDDVISGFGDITVGYRITSTAADVQETQTWTTASASVAMVAVIQMDVSSPPVNTVPANGIQTTSDITQPDSGYTAIPGAAVTAGTNPVTYFNFNVPSGKGKLKMTLNGTTAVTAGANDSNTVTLGSWSSLAELNNTIATLKFRGEPGIHEKITVNMVSSDGTTPDNDSFYILNDMRKVTATGTNAQIAALMSNIDLILEDSAGGTVTLTVTDAGALSDQELISLILASGFGSGYISLLRRRRR